MPSAPGRGKCSLASARTVMVIDGGVGASEVVVPWRTPTTGMVVDADVSTGTKSLLRYLLKPIYRSLDSAFSER